MIVVLGRGSGKACAVVLGCDRAKTRLCVAAGQGMGGLMTRKGGLPVGDGPVGGVAECAVLWSSEDPVG
jgi:hypothetical protein